MKKININIWDDFYEDGYVPENEIQETYAYIEDNNISDEIKKECLTILFDNIKNKQILSNVDILLEFHDYKNNYKTETVKRCLETYGDDFFIKRWEIKLKNINHKQLDILIEELNNEELMYNSIPFNIYSES